MAGVDLRDILAELERRKALSNQPAIQFLDSNFKAQSQFIQDPARLKACLCTRRAGKSYGAGLYLFKEAYENPGVACVYIALSRGSAKRIMWAPILKKINKQFKLGAKFHETELSVTLPNGSIIYLVGLDDSDDQQEKLLGAAYRLAIIDEAASYGIDLAKLVYSTLGKAMSDFDGTICMIGTPSNFTKSLFFKVTTGSKDPEAQGWSVHKWNASDNPYQAKQHARDIAEIQATRPLFMDTPAYKQMYLGEWVVDDTARCYKFSDSRNLYAALPNFNGGRWHYVLGVDLGYEDSSAFVLVSYHDHDHRLYVRSVFKKPKMDITDVANKIKEYVNAFDIDTIVVDGANKQAVEEMKNRHGLALVPADKTGKADFIEIASSELIQGHILLSEAECQPLIDEMLGLVWNEKSSRKEENPNAENHATDAFLYAWRFCYQYLSEAPKAVAKFGSPEWYAEQEEIYVQQLEARLSGRHQAFELEAPAFDLQNWSLPNE